MMLLQFLAVGVGVAASGGCAVAEAVAVGTVDCADGGVVALLVIVAVDGGFAAVASAFVSSIFVAVAVVECCCYSH